jgi:hypothetical protein
VFEHRALAKTIGKSCCAAVVLNAALAVLLSHVLPVR